VSAGRKPADAGAGELVAFDERQERLADLIRKTADSLEAAGGDVLRLNVQELIRDAGDALDLAREALDDEAEGHFTDAVRVASLLTRQLHELTEAW